MRRPLISLRNYSREGEGGGASSPGRGSTRGPVGIAHLSHPMVDPRGTVLSRARFWPERLPRYLERIALLTMPSSLIRKERMTLPALCVSDVCRANSRGKMGQWQRKSQSHVAHLLRSLGVLGLG